MTKRARGRKTKAQKDATAYLDQYGWGEETPLPDVQSIELEEVSNSSADCTWDITSATVVDGLISEWLSRLSEQWQHFDFAGLTDDAKAIVQLLIWAGLTEQRVSLTVCKTAGPKETITCILSGDFGDVLQKRLNAIIPEWIEWLMPEFREFRLTPDGSKAKADLLSGDEMRACEALLWVRRVSPALGPRKVAGTAQIGTKQADPKLTPEEERQKFCFEQWQAGCTLKEINVALKRHATWEHYDDDKAVRGPINAWGKRIGVEPRKGQPGRRSKKT